MTATYFLGQPGQFEYRCLTPNRISGIEKVGRGELRRQIAVGELGVTFEARYNARQQAASGYR